MRRIARVGVITIVAGLSIATVVEQVAVGADSDPPSAEVGADGNAFTGGLKFDPARVIVHAGQVVRWTNNDFAVPHTATEDHQLWDLGGTYGQTPANPSGFAPGTSVQREFSAGTWRYYCRVHPAQMHGVVKAKLRVRKRARVHGSYPVVVIWSFKALPAGQVFDVQRRLDGSWRTVIGGTSKLRGTFDGGPVGTVSKFRARVKKDSHPSIASGYSPQARIKVG